MTIFVTAELEVAAPLAQTFAHFIDFPRWHRWMPQLFYPLSGPERALQQGDKLKVRIGKFPISVDIVRLRQDGELCWRGGARWLIQGEHAFKFEQAGNKTRILSEETLSGLLVVRALKSHVTRSAAEEALVLMQRFARYLATVEERHIDQPAL